MNELDRLIAHAERLARTGEQLSTVFAAELATVWRDADRELRRLVLDVRQGSVSAAVQATRAVALKDQVRAILTASGYDALIVAATDTATSTLIREVLSEKTAAEVAAFRGSSAPLLDALTEIARIDLLAQGDEIAVSLWRSLSQYLLTTRPVNEILDDLADALDESSATVRTLFDTQVSIYGRQVEHASTGALGPAQPFLYVGPIDDKTRDWCLARVGKVYSRAAIDAMDNGQLPNPFLTAGGWNCRHSWLAVESQELRALTDTGEAVPIYAEDVTRIRARQQAKRAARKRRAA